VAVPVAQHRPQNIDPAAGPGSPSYAKIRIKRPADTARVICRPGRLAT